MTRGGPRTRVAALAGRRIDAASSVLRRFPLENIDRVGRALHALFAHEHIGMLVCSAACGADLIALDIARKQGIRRVIVLPYAIDAFRRSSVIDRPGDWGKAFDEIISSTSANDVVVLNSSENDDAYEDATREIIRRAKLAAGSTPAIAIAVWEGDSSQKSGATASFLSHARSAKMTVREIVTC